MYKTLAIAALAASTAQAQVVWDEAIDGALSNDPAAPTDLGTFGAGGLIVRGSTLGPGTPPSDGFDVFEFDIAPGFEITSIILSAYSPNDPFATSGFNFSTGAAASEAGATILFGPGWGGANVGQDLFSAGFPFPITSPLGADTYFMEVREFGGPQANWELTFNVVPAPASAALLGLGGLAAARRRR
ncbi:MAG: PEP-CTERM sorting domain-containing protein [Planctomycetota bacterium]